MNARLRTLLALFLVALLAALVGCGKNNGNGLDPIGGGPDGDGDGGGDVTTTAALSIDELGIRAFNADGALRVELPLTRVAGTTFDADVTVELRNLAMPIDAAPAATATRTVRVEAAALTATVDVTDWADLPDGTADAGPLGGWVIRYVIDDPRGQIAGRRSLFEAWEKRSVSLVAASEINIEGETRVRVLAADADGTPLAEREVTATLVSAAGEREVFTGSTDEFGALSVPLDATAEELGDVELIVRIATDDGHETISTALEVVREERILMTTDKPLYQPGQRIHVRTLALSRPSLSPAADRPILFEVYDADGNKVFRDEGTTDAFGVASLEVPLASELNMGDWRISATMDGVSTERTVRVERYVLPRFGVTLRQDRDFYRPGDTALVDIDAQYFFGQPVSGGKVTVQPWTFDVGFNPLEPIDLELDDNGMARVEVPIPTFLVGTPLEQGNAFVRLDVTVTDATEHEETATRSLVVSEQAILQTIIPASDLVAGSDATFYVLTRTPSGAALAAENTLTFDGDTFDFETDELGYAELVLSLPPTAGDVTLSLASTDDNGERATRDFTFAQGAADRSIAVVSDGSLYSVGDEIQLDILTGGNPPRVFMDVVRDGQVLLTDTVELSNGRGEVSLPVSADLGGALQIDVYYVTTQAQIIRGRRLVYVEGADDLTVEYTTDRDEYRPGDPAEIEVRVTDGEGQGVVAAVGLTIVDEAVFALQDMQPGLERVYFQLEEELLQPQYNLYGWSMTDIVAAGEVDDEERETAAAVVLAATAPPGFGDLVNSLAPALQQADGMADSYGRSDMQRIADAFVDLSERGVFDETDWSDADTMEGVLERIGFFHDPWGQPYDIQPSLDGAAGWDGVTAVGTGPDETKGTDDDITRTWYRWELTWQDPDRWDDDFGGGGMADAGAGGGDWGDPEPPNVDDGTDPSEGGGGDAPRVRQYFPETLLVMPDIITNPDGTYTIDVDMADSITTWRITGMASSASGQLGSATGGIRVFQPFFIDIDFPVELTQNDRVAVPVALFNYLDTAQTVELQVDLDASGDWFTLLSDDTLSVDLDPGEVTVRYFDVRVDRVGLQPFQVTGIGSTLSDAVRRSVRVSPDGQQQDLSISDRLAGDVTHTITIPAAAIDEASQLFVKVYPGLFSQVVEGLDSLLQVPSGCFEQTSSTTYPNVLVLRYLQETGTGTPEIELRATEYIAQGYQRLLSYEVTGGGFEWFGGDPAHRILTAYGLLEFYDMSQVFDVDPAVITRTQDWLLSQQEADGRFRAAQEGIHEGATNNFTDSDLRATAYLTYALVESGATGPQVDSALTWLRGNLSGVDDPYSLGMVANALLAADPSSSLARDLLDDLDDAKQTDETAGGVIYWWESGSQSLYYGGGDAMTMETTALILQAMIRAGGYSDTVQGIVGYLISNKDTFGNFASTQATILSLRAFIELLLNSTPEVAADIRVLLGGAEIASFSVDASNSDLMRQFDLSDLAVEGDNDVTIEFSGEGALLYQIVGRYWIPWELVDDPGSDDVLSIDMAYDRTNLAVDEMIEVTTTVTNHSAARQDMIMLDLGIPPGFEPVIADFSDYIDDASNPVSRVERSGRQLTVYVYGLDAGETLALVWHLQATMVVEAQTPPSSVWLYYDSDTKSDAEPVEIVVN